MGCKESDMTEQLSLSDSSNNLQLKGNINKTINLLLLKKIERFLKFTQKRIQDDQNNLDKGVQS